MPKDISSRAESENGETDGSRRERSRREGDGTDASNSDGTERGLVNVSRRTYLNAVTAGTYAAAGLGSTTVASGATSRHGIQFDRVLDAVDDLGCDNSGNNDVSGKVENTLETGTLIEFPPGTYRWDGLANVEGNRMGFLGTGSTKDDVRFTCPAGNHRIWKLVGTDLLFENFVFDQGSNFDRFIGHYTVFEGGTCYMLDLGHRGTEPSESEVDLGSRNRGYPVHALGGRGGHLHFEGYDSAVPVHFDSYPNNRAFFWMGRNAYGTAHFEDLHIEYGSGSVFYAGKDGMDEIVWRDCSFFNCRDKVIRATKRSSVIDNCTFEVDMANDHPDNELLSSDAGRNIRCIWGQSAELDYTGPTIKDSEFIIEDPYGNGVDVVYPILMNDRTTGARVKSCRIENNGNQASISGDDGGWDIDTTHFTGSGSGAAVDVGGGTLHDSCIDMPNGGGVYGIPDSNESGTQYGGCDRPGDHATTISYEDDATAVHASHYDTADEAGVEFTVTNTADQELTVTYVTVTPHDLAINGLSDGDGAVGKWVSEVHVDADVQNGVCDVGGGTSLPNEFDMANDGSDDSADEVAIMSAGSSASVALSRFEDDGTPVNMSGEHIDIDVDYQLDDGSVGNSSFTAVVDGDANAWPNCTIANPSDGATVSGTVTVQVDAGDAEDDDATLAVEVAIDGGTWQNAAYNSSSGYYEYDWDTTAESDGDHTIDARATDSDGTTTHASQVTVTVDNQGGAVIEDFERTDPLAEYGGTTSLYSVETATVYEGSQALVNDSGSYGSVVSTSGLDSYPSRGDEVHYFFDNAADDNFVAFHFFAQAEEDVPDSYQVGVGNSGGWHMWRLEGGSANKIAEGALSTSDQIDGWYRAEVRSDSTTVYADLYDHANDTLLASIQADDTTYTSGGIGFRSTGSGEVWDYVIDGSANTGPSCIIASPSDGATVSGTVTVQVDAGDAEDDDATLAVEVAIDGGTWQNAAYNSSSGYYEYDWDTTAESDGDHTIDARATDSDGTTTHASQVTVTVDNQTGVATALHKYTFDHNWVTQSHSSSFGSPVTLAKPISYDGGQPAHTRLGNVSGSSFDSKVEEWEYLDGSHIDETVSSLTLEEGTGTTDDGTPLEAGTVTTTDSLNWASISFAQSFATAPVVVSQVQTSNGGQAVVTRNRNVSTGGFDTAMQEEQALGAHIEETIGYVAVEPATGTLDGAAFEAGTVSGVDDTWTTISFSRSYTDPIFLAGMQTVNGDDPCALRYRNLTGDSVEVFVEEEGSADDETTHANAETVGFLVVEGN
jgi:hypothetical protein